MTEKSIIGYKGFFNQDGKLYCMNYNYVPNTKHIHRGTVVPRKNGFHFCRKLKDVISFYPMWDNVVYYKIEASGTIIHDDNISVCSEIKLIEDMTDYAQYS